MKRTFAGLIIIVTGVWAAWMSCSLATPPSASAASEAKESSTEPVERDMHEFMEYVFQPTYKRLKTAMAATPADNTEWKSIKADSLILAEGGNLLLGRLAEADAVTWSELSVGVRKSGGELYRAAKSKDYAAARRHYETMLLNCNRCHDKFAHGEHQLTP